MSANAQAACLRRAAWHGNWTMERDELNLLLRRGLDYIDQLSAFNLGHAIDAANGLHDAISDRLGRLGREADDAGIPPEDATIDVVALDAMIDKLERAYRLQTKKGYGK